MTILLQDDFETIDFSKWDATVINGGTGTVVATAPYRGSYHAKFTVDGVAAPEYAYVRKDFPAQLVIYFRAYVQFLTSPSNGFSQNFMFLEGSPVNIAWVYVYNDGGTLRWQIQYRTSVGYFYSYAASGPALNTWYSVELYVKIDSVNGEYKLIVNGVQVISITGVDNAFGHNGVTRVIPIIICDEILAATIYFDSIIIADTIVGPDATGLTRVPHASL